MKFSISSSDLLKHLQITGGAISNNPVLPILEDFLFTISGTKLTIAASDLETTIISETEVIASEKDGVVAVPAKILLETLKALPQQPITFSINDETFGIEITSAYGKYKLAGENGQDFPEIPVMDTVDTVTIPSNTLVQGINKTLFATSNDELRPSMAGVYFQIDFSKITFVATDAHKLVKYTFSDIASDVSTSFIVPKKSLNLVKNALVAGESVGLSFNKANAFFISGNMQIISRLVDARYPDYNAVIPVDNPNTLVLPRQDLLNSLRRIAIYANKSTNQVVFNILADSLTVSAQDLDFSNEAIEQLTCTYEGQPMSIGFNAKFMAEMLGVMEADDIKLELSGPTRAGILVPSEQKDTEDIMMLVMPVMVGY